MSPSHMPTEKIGLVQLLFCILRGGSAGGDAAFFRTFQLGTSRVGFPVAGTATGANLLQTICLCIFLHIASHGHHIEVSVCCKV